MIIYKTTNLITGKIYVGQDSKNNPNYLGSGKYFCLAVKKYGKENFKKEILSECSNRIELDEKEKYWIKELNCKVPKGYNIKDGGEGGDTYTNSSEENKMKFIEKMRKPKSEEHKKNLKLAQKRPEVLEKKRKPKSEEFKKNMKLAQNLPEVLEKQRRPHGFFSEEARRNMKLSQQKRRERERKHNAKRWGN